MAALLTSD